jgi:hypothetical protein
MFAGARSARHGRAAERAPFEPHIDFDCRIAARIENLARDYCLDVALRHKTLCPLEN